MFEKLYKSVNLKVQPSTELINQTKRKMKEELNSSKKVVHMNLYKYGTLAACLVIFIGVLSVNTTKNIVMEEMPSINESVKDSYNSSTNIHAGGNLFNSAFDSTMSSGAVTSTTVSRNSILASIAEFFIAITQWFKELLF